MKRYIALAAVAALSAAPFLSAQVRIEPRPVAPTPTPPSVSLTTWSAKLYERNGPATTTVPDPPEFQSCAKTVVLPDSLALVGGPDGVHQIDTWQVYAHHWTAFVSPPTAVDTLRAQVIGADCSAAPIRILLRAGSDFVAAHPESFWPKGVYIIGKTGALTPAMITDADSMKEIHVEPMSANFLRHLSDRVPANTLTPLARAMRAESTRPKSVMSHCLAAGRLQARAADEEMAKIHAMPGSDEMSAPPSSDVAEARDANIVSIRTTMPGVFLPELR